MRRFNAFRIHLEEDGSTRGGMGRGRILRCYLQDIVSETIGLEDLPRIFRQMMDGRMRGRLVVRV